MRSPPLRCRYLPEPEQPSPGHAAYPRRVTYVAAPPTVLIPDFSPPTHQGTKKSCNRWLCAAVVKESRRKVTSAVAINVIRFILSLTEETNLLPNSTIRTLCSSSCEAAILLVHGYHV